MSTLSSVADLQTVRALARTLPRSTGVYLYFGEATLPLYIGKSVDMRGRFLSHLRTPAEAAMMRQVRRVDCIETAGELGALLLEASLIKQRMPLFNQRLRRTRRLHVLRLASLACGGLQPRIEGLTGTPLECEAARFGLFKSRSAAVEHLRSLAQAHELCLGLLGIERMGSRGCFGLQLGRCRGACVGREPRQTHDQRLQEALDALRVHAWPYAGPIRIVERAGDWVQSHEVHDWRYLHTDCSRQGRIGAGIQQSFDADIYRLLVRPILEQQADIVQVAGEARSLARLMTRGGEQAGALAEA
ncbi:endonuclease [Bordetella avium]|uniref:endonuclease n=1 Tax=Bordetella avium TaxID=521 RepID=UPI000E0B3EFC|nr:endonuclease [Bordetella avium]RIQ14220.1 endonuclease [Bordetella avium]RIQ39915.1 endonuclease [Bordetella avium]RIQ44714.1 endonuclease [Bordetella avium]RIQ45067.1 endonuclease [Bordetella avium]RIQ47694.1 endonuclease [Bordetella avium]